MARGHTSSTPEPTDARVAAGAAMAGAAIEEHGAALAGDPEPLVAGYGPWAFRCRLAAGLPAWPAEVVVRVGEEDGLAREAAWHQWAVGAGVPVVALLARSATAIVFETGPPVSLTERLGERPGDAGALLGLLGEQHARLHDTSTADAPESSSAADAVVVHGDFQPAHLRVGDDPASVCVTNWTAAQRGAAEWDVARTVLTLWSAPYLAPGRMERMVLKMARDGLVDAYLGGYRVHRPLDDRALARWGAEHAADWAERVGQDTPPTDPWDPVGLIVDRESYRKDLIARARDLTS